MKNVEPRLKSGRFYEITKQPTQADVQVSDHDNNLIAITQRAEDEGRVYLDMVSVPLLIEALKTWVSPSTASAESGRTE